MISGLSRFSFLCDDTCHFSASVLMIILHLFGVYKHNKQVAHDLGDPRLCICNKEDSSGAGKDSKEPDQV